MTAFDEFSNSFQFSGLAGGTNRHLCNQLLRAYTSGSSGCDQKFFLQNFKSKNLKVEIEIEMVMVRNIRRLDAKYGSVTLGHAIG
jgi:hypothetical protein